MQMRTHSEFMSTFSDPTFLLRQGLDFSPKDRVKSWLSDRLFTICRMEFHGIEVELETKRRDAEIEGISDEAILTQMIHLRAERSLALENIAHTLDMAWPNFDPNNAGFVKLWIDEKGRVNGRKGRVLMRAGKAFRKMFPSLTDFEIQTLVDQYLDHFRLQKLTLKTSKTADDFRRAYSHTQCAMQNPSTTYTRKALANSCMRYSFDHLPNHPAEAFASGDFMIVWTENQDGHIASRCVVCTKSEPNASAPIYGVSEQAIDMIDAYIRENEIALSRDYSWKGAKMKIIRESDGYVLPYLDLDPKYYTLIDDETLVVGQFDNGETINGSGYSGLLYLEDGAYTCCDCDSRIDEDDTYHDDHGHTYCHDCYYDTYFNCGRCNEDNHRDEIVEVNFISRWGSTSECWCSFCANDHAVECTDGETWALEDATCVQDEEWVSPNDLDTDYFVSDWDGEYHPISDQIEISIDGSELFTETVSITEIEDIDAEYELINGVYHKIKTEGESENDELITENA